MRTRPQRSHRLVALLVPLLLASVWSLAGEEGVIANRLGISVEAIYALVRGHQPEQIAGPLDAGGESSYDRDDLRACSRLVVRIEGETVIQFFTTGYLNDAERIELRQIPLNEDKTAALPVLAWREDGRFLGAVAGLPFHLLQGDMAYGMTREKFAEWFDPLGVGDGLEYFFALDLGGASWSVPDVAADIVFADDAESGETVLSVIAMETGFAGETLSQILEELRYARVTPTIMEFAGGEKAEFVQEEDSDAGWQALMEGINGMKASDFSEDEPILRLVFEDPDLRYEVQFDMAESLARLRIDKK